MSMLLLVMTAVRRLVWWYLASVVACYVCVMMMTPTTFGRCVGFVVASDLVVSYVVN